MENTTKTETAAAQKWTEEDRLMGRIPWACRYCDYSVGACDFDEQRMHTMFPCAGRKAAAAKAASKPAPGNCGKCGGYGKIGAFRSRDNGTCYACKGTGNIARR